MLNIFCSIGYSYILVVVIQDHVLFMQYLFAYANFVDPFKHINFLSILLQLKKKEKKSKVLYKHLGVTFES